MDSVNIVDEMNNVLRARAGARGQSCVKLVVKRLGRRMDPKIGKRVMMYYMGI